MSTQIERSNTTRTNIVAAARLAFVTNGYYKSSLETIAADAGCTKGALYHHYDGKVAVLAAVFQSVCGEILQTAGREAVRTGDPRKRLKSAAQSWLKAVERSDARAILLDVAPRALGFARARALEDAIALEALVGLVRAVVDAEGLGDCIDDLLTARLVNAALTEIALLRYASEGQAPSLRQAENAISGIIDGVLKRAG